MLKVKVAVVSFVIKIYVALFILYENFTAQFMRKSSALQVFTSFTVCFHDRDSRYDAQGINPI